MELTGGKASAHQQKEVNLARALVFHWFLSGHRWHVGNKTKASYAKKKKKKRKREHKKVFHNLHWKTLALLLKEIICKWIFFFLTVLHICGHFHCHQVCIVMEQEQKKKQNPKLNNTVVLQLQES